VEETGLYWKQMPSRTYNLVKEKYTHGFKASKSRVTLLVEGNANGDEKSRLMLVYRREYPQALKNAAKSSLHAIHMNIKRQ
jgi:hypothetical protein